ncbi:hypothetical protein VTJ04DRAFT_6925 [Mycothermus thermophilus]|uniref:uncharacterized protein n=1 Tax=Humicola insolens TaxID=85995 RepID=UPI0037447AD0
MTGNHSPVSMSTLGTQLTGTGCGTSPGMEEVTVNHGEETNRLGGLMEWVYHGFRHCDIQMGMEWLVRALSMQL